MESSELQRRKLDWSMSTYIPAGYVLKDIVEYKMLLLVMSTVSYFLKTDCEARCFCWYRLTRHFKVSFCNLDFKVTMAMARICILW